MEHTKGLREYIGWSGYRESLGLPEEVLEHYEMLAQGEYNRNYVFTHPGTGKKLVLRVNFGSQMHLEDQIGYEYRALELLGESKRTPLPLYMDGSRKRLPCGVMVLEYLPGHPLDYGTELMRAAGCLADIHSVQIPEQNHLIAPKEPLRAILEECEAMVKTYMDSPLGDAGKKETIRSLLQMVWKKADELPGVPYRCCINTELNSTNFLINGIDERDYLIDWEKPLYGDPAQDLGHFLAPTTTFWKTDVILSREKTDAFVREYIRQVDGKFDTAGLEERTNLYLPITCLRGITWCAMAWVEYQKPGKAIVNPSTQKKLEEYLKEEFLEKIRQFIMG